MYFLFFFVCYSSSLFYFILLQLVWEPFQRKTELCWTGVYFPAQLVEISDIQLRLSRPSFDSVPCREGVFGLNTGHCNMIPWFLYSALITLTHF